MIWLSLIVLAPLAATVHVTAVLVTHDQAEALDVANRVAVLNSGRIEQIGTPTEVYDTVPEH